MKFLITGGTGFLGNRLTNTLLEEGHEVVIVTRRSRPSENPKLRYVAWDGKSIAADAGPTDVVINLAGASIADRKWTKAYKHILKQSRIDASQACVNYINAQETPPKLFLAGSAIGYYGGDSSGVMDESSAAGSDFMAEICTSWEKAAEGANTRTVFVRTGVILGNGGGPLEVMVKPFQFFVGGPIADGKQYLPWMHIDDWIGAIQFLIEKDSISGPVLLTSPKPESNAVFSKYLAAVLGRPNLFRVPKFALNLLMGEQAVIAWGSTQTNPKVLQENGYKFKYPELKGALENLIQ